MGAFCKQWETPEPAKSALSSILRLLSKISQKSTKPVTHCKAMQMSLCTIYIQCLILRSQHRYISRVVCHVIMISLGYLHQNTLEHIQQIHMPAVYFYLLWQDYLCWLTKIVQNSANVGKKKKTTSMIHVHEGWNIKMFNPFSLSFTHNLVL